MILSKYKLLIICPLLLCLVLLFPAGAIAAEEPASFTLTVIHTNDFHDYDPYALAQKATLIKKIRSTAKNVLLLDAGDLYTRGPYHQIFYGELEMAAYNALRYDAWELGNNEFKGRHDLAQADEKLYNLINQAAFPTLCANIKTSTGEYLPGVVPYIIKDVNGIKVGIIGVSSLKVKGYRQGASKIVEDPVKIAADLFPEVQEKTDIQIILSHAGLAMDKKMDKQLTEKGLSLIVGGDDHYLIRQPVQREGGIPIVQAGGENDIYLGRINLNYQKQNGKWVLLSHYSDLYHITPDIPLDEEIKGIIDKYMEKAAKPAA